ncbi:hypothetical protein B7988_02540 [Fibrobacter sp. UWB1]|jgi:hypothetical protein|uniref:hypothetical protein n=1 Tax=Fibrobacter sp. UWB1 TaxID=1964355 RepID=UPI000B51E9CD|nr:hypothetical protein [Fibrobacter sp. UWB1]OWV27057.1 hypothetical protein B7988_02540 [Fibrobacter sp. UWB1]
MSEELNEKETTAEAPAEVAPVVETETAPAPEAETVPQEGAVEEAVATPTQPQVIVQRERGFSHYVGFALLSVLCICFYFMPGIAITFAISLIPGISLGAVAAWTFSAIFSVIAWAIFKMKIKGFKKSFYFYIGLCVLISILLVVIEILTEETNVFAKIVSLLCGAA